jgi:dipeptidase E
MKFLLTGTGFRFSKAADIVLNLVGKPADQVSVVIIPTAANIQRVEKSWMIEDLCKINGQGYKFIDIVDISALPKERWLPRLEAADVLFFSGGNAFYLVDWLQKSGLAEILPELLQTRVYVGASAGAIVTGLGLKFCNSKGPRRESGRIQDQPGLGLVDFYVVPHLNTPSPNFQRSQEPYIKQKSQELSEKIYAFSDDTVLKVVDDQVEVIGEGEWLELN